MKQDNVGRGSPQFSLRMPLNMREKLKVMAKQNRRSINSEILALVENAIDLKESNQNAAH